ncbi:MAG: NADH:flavin oxidoreductase, partial [Deltaproteobacteria bacterium]|nr:NADH:flavin oxidoreductase [Deltaproteobacteria bacterium]
SPFFFFFGRSVGPFAYRPGVNPLGIDEIEQIVETYAMAASRARKVGADAIQIHAGHGYPLGQFLSPFFNRREDRYGGSSYNRARIFLEIRKAIAERAGTDFPVWIKMNAYDSVPGGMTPEDAEPYGTILGDAGYSAIEVTGGSPEGSYDSRGPLKRDSWFEGYYVDHAARIKATCDLPVVAVGGIRRLKMVEEILSKGGADMISMSRPFICEPDLILRWQSGETKPSHCKSCNGCVELMRKGKGLVCVSAISMADQ